MVKRKTVFNRIRSRKNKIARNNNSSNARYNRYNNIIDIIVDKIKVIKEAEEKSQ